MKPIRIVKLSTNSTIPLIKQSHSGLSSRAKPASTPSLSINNKISDFSLRLLMTPKQSVSPNEVKFSINSSPIEILTQAASPKQLPTKLSSLSSFEEAQDKNGLGTPATRKDVKDLKEWLNNMLNKAIGTTSSPESLYETANLIYKVCFQEIIRQVKVQCKERGDLIKLVWETYQELFKQAIKITQAKQEYNESLHGTEIENLQKNNEKQVNDLLRMVGEARKENNRLTKELKIKEEAYDKKFHKEVKMLQVLEVFKQQYSKLKEELLTIKEEYRITKIKLENLQNISNKAAEKFKPKSSNFIKDLVTKDPLIKYDGTQDDKDVIKTLVESENLTEDLFTRHDYKDQETNTNIQTFASTSINTQIEDLCGESVGVKTRKKRYSKISATNTISISATQSESLVEVNEELLNKNEYLDSDMRKKHVFVKKLLQNMNQNINYELVKQDLPHSNILNAVSAGITRALTIIISSSLETMTAAEVNEGDNEEKGKKLLINIIGSEEEKMIYSEHEIVASMMIRKIGMTPAFKLKHAMFKKMLLKLITSFYEDKIKDPSSKIEYGVYVYSLLMKKYMMKKAAQNRFKHLLSSCVKYKNINRVRIFGRFIGLYGAFDLNDLNFYLTNAQNLKLGLAGKLFVNSETSEQHLTQYGRCLECLKYVSKSFPPTETQDLYHKLDLMKHVDKQSKITVVDIDEFLEVVIEKHHSHKSESYTFLKYIYDSADVIPKQLNEDGYLQHREFSLLIRNLSSTPVSEGNRLFEAFAENFLSENDVEVRAISLENFVELHATNPIFTQEKVAEFTGVKNDLEAEGKLEGVHEELEVRLNEIQWRLSESKELGEYQEEFSNLLETLRLKIYSYNKCSNPKAVWLCLRLLEEESKILLIHDRLNELLPRFAQGVL